jgi:thermitase
VPAGETIGERSRRRASLAVVLALLVLAPDPVAEAGSTPEHVVVGLGEDPMVPDAVDEDAIVETLDGLDALVVEADEPARLAERVREDPSVEYAQPGRRVDWLASTPDDPLFADQRGVRQAGLPGAWDATTGSTAVTLCVVDTGVRHTHEDIAANWVGGFDAVEEDGDPTDDHGHGTHVAGIAAAGHDNGIGIAGAANLELVGARVLDEGTGTYADVAEGIARCADRGSDVIGLSIGAAFGHPVLEDAVEHAADRGALMVAAAGNAGCEGCVEYPAAYEQVLAVGCTDRNGEVCSFSARGEQVEITAPGVDMLGPWASDDTAYARLSGTSQSTAIVAGSAALADARSPLLEDTGLRALAAQTVDDRGAAGRDAAYGHGALDAQRLVEAAQPVLEATFDDPATRFATNGAWHVTNACASARTEPAYLGYHDEAACRWRPAADATASATVDLSSASLAVLQFSHAYRLASPTDAALGPTLVVEASSPGGGEPERLVAFSGTDANWSSPAVNLSGLAPGTVELQFTVEPGVVGPLEPSGWFVDDVLVVGDETDPGVPPTARFDARCDPSTCTFDASKSLDDDRIAGYAWAFGDGEQATGQTITHAYDEPGVYEAELTVVDEQGGIDRVRQRVLATTGLTG